MSFDEGTKRDRRAHGLLIVYTGSGKGKTTAALGLAVRAAGHRKRVRVIQFIKGNRKTGEYRFVNELNGTSLIDFHTFGRGFVRRSDDREADRRLAREAWAFALETMMDAEHELVILDELTYPIEYGFLDEAEVLEAVAARPDHIHIVVTGRRASERMIAAADLVTQVCNLKHPLERGIKAQKGIEF